MAPEALIELMSSILIGAIAMLDSLPDYIRAMLSGALLVLFLRYFEAKIPASDIQYSEAFCKTGLLALLLVPLIVCLLPSIRMAVFVAEVPASADSVGWGWLLVFGIWLCGCIGSAAALAGGRWRLRRGYAEATRRMEDERLCGRLQHWQERLGLRSTLEFLVINGAEPRHLIGGNRIAMPSAALHWSPAVQDLLIIHALCHIKQRHAGWHLLAQIVSCCYWPISWVPILKDRLIGDFQIATDALAESCFQDSLGYQRSLRQIEQRLSQAAAEPVRSSAGAHPSWQAATRKWLHEYGLYLQGLFHPRCELPWKMTNRRKVRDDLRWVEPYDKVFLFVGQAVFGAFLLTGVTLKEIPPDIEEADFGFFFQIHWMDEVFRDSQRPKDKEDPPRP